MPFILTNARLVLPNEVVRGTIVVRAGLIVEVDHALSRAPGVLDLDGDFLIPGLVDLHTDNLEQHYRRARASSGTRSRRRSRTTPRCAGSGITTVFDSLVLGAASGWDMRDEGSRPMLDGPAHGAIGHGMLKVEHRLHMRCEVTHPDIVPLPRALLPRPAVGFMSLMDHAPGDRQSPDIEAYRRRYRKVFGGERGRRSRHIVELALLEGSRRHAPGNRRRSRACSRAPAAVREPRRRRREHIEEARSWATV